MTYLVPVDLGFPVGVLQGGKGILYPVSPCCKRLIYKNLGASQWRCIGCQSSFGSSIDYSPFELPYSPSMLAIIDIERRLCAWLDRSDVRVELKF